MKLILRNIGLLESAELEINTLSVIAGENDNGKSTVGKIMFCLIKAISRYKEDLEESKEYKLHNGFREVYFLLRNEIRFQDSDKLEDNLSTLRVLQDSSENFQDKLSLVEEQIHHLKQQDASADTINYLITTYNKLLQLINEPENARKSMENALRKVFAAEFDSRILLEGEKNGFIGLYDHDIKLIEINILENNHIELLHDVEPVKLKDATFIDTPLILNNYNLLVGSKTLLDIQQRRLSRLGSAYTTLHTKDLFDKLVEPSFPDLFKEFLNEDFSNKLKSILNGEVLYDTGKRDFLFNTDSGIFIPIKNTASGIKVFGILQLLLKNDFIDQNSLLIFDEPENHLHPKWQLKLAELLTHLASIGIPILVSSHSPYMIEALKRYSDKVKLEHKAKFYLAKNKSIQNKDNLEEIFKILSEPFSVFREMDREDLKDE